MLLERSSQLVLGDSVSGSRGLAGFQVCVALRHGVTQAWPLDGLSSSLTGLIRVPPKRSQLIPPSWALHEQSSRSDRCNLVSSVGKHRGRLGAHSGSHTAHCAGSCLRPTMLTPRPQPCASQEGNGGAFLGGESKLLLEPQVTSCLSVCVSPSRPPGEPRAGVKAGGGVVSGNVLPSQIVLLMRPFRPLCFWATVRVPSICSAPLRPQAETQECKSAPEVAFPR